MNANRIKVKKNRSYIPNWRSNKELYITISGYRECHVDKCKIKLLPVKGVTNDTTVLYYDDLDEAKHSLLQLTEYTDNNNNAFIIDETGKSPVRYNYSDVIQEKLISI